MSTYNGWTNYATWKHNLEFVNADFWREVFSDEAIEKSGMEIEHAVESLTDALEEELLDYIDTLEEGYARSVLTAEMTEINFREIAQNILEV